MTETVPPPSPPDPTAPARRSIADDVLALVDTMTRLRKDCPWDRAQTVKSLRPYLLEEAHEVLAVLDAFLALTEPRVAAAPLTRALRVSQLEGGMVLARDLMSAGGMLMLTAGHVLTPALIKRIGEFEAREKSQLVAHVQPQGVSA